MDYIQFHGIKIFAIQAFNLKFYIFIKLNYQLFFIQKIWLKVQSRLGMMVSKQEFKKFLFINLQLVKMLLFLQSMEKHFPRYFFFKVLYFFFNYQEIVNNWINSEGHRKNLLSETNTCGIGVYRFFFDNLKKNYFFFRSDDGLWYFTQIFAKCIPLNNSFARFFQSLKKIF